MAFSGFVGASMSEREAIDNMAAAFSKRASDLGRAGEAQRERRQHPRATSQLLTKDRIASAHLDPNP